MDDLKTATNTKNPNTAPGEDRITVSLVKLGGHTFAYHLLALINCSLSRGIIPSPWRRNKAFALHKSGSHADPNNFRIITISSVLSRITERCIFRRLLSALNRNPAFRFHAMQAGFRRGHSTVDALAAALGHIKACMTSGTGLPAAFLDICKAFDSVPHDRLIRKLFSAGISGRLLKWISSFLRDRLVRSALCKCQIRLFPRDIRRPTRSNHLSTALYHLYQRFGHNRTICMSFYPFRRRYFDHAQAYTAFRSLRRSATRP
jgi:hypothetical protein